MNAIKRIGWSVRAILAMSLLVAVAAPAALAAAQADEQEPVTITFWTTNQDGYSEWVAQFEESHPNVTVETEFIGNYDEMAQKVQAAIAGGVTPNVAQMGQRHGLPQVIDAGALIPVEEYLDQADIDDIYPGLWSRYTYKGSRYAVPFGSSTPGMWYNVTLFEEAGLDPNTPPQTWDEVVAYARELTKDTTGDGRIDQWGFSTCADVPWYVRPMILQAGGQVFDEDGNPTISGPEGVETLRFFQDAVYEHEIAAPVGHQTAEMDFKSGRIGLLFCSAAVRAAFTEEIGDSFAFDFAFLPEKEQRAVGLGGMSLVVFNGSDEEVEAAAELVRFLTSTDLTAEMGIITGYVAIRQSALEDPRIQELLAEDPYAPTIYDQLQYVSDTSINPADAILWSGLLDAVETVQTDPNADPQEVLDQLQAEIQTYLANYD